MNWYKINKTAIFQSIVSPKAEDYNNVQNAIYDTDEQHNRNINDTGNPASMEDEMAQLRSLRMKIDAELALFSKRSIEETPEESTKKEYLQTMKSRINERYKQLQNRISFVTPRPAHNPLKSKPSDTIPINSNLNSFAGSGVNR